ncbi:hypothetical protein [Undibacterium sp. Ji49W]
MKMQKITAANPFVFHSFWAGEARQFYVLHSNMTIRQARQALVAIDQ